MTSSVFASERLLFTPTSPHGDAIPIIFAFPNEYTVGITSLGYQVVWATLATREDVQVSRLFTDVQEPLPRKAELLGFSISWELDYVNILSLLESLDIPIRATSRNDFHPLVFGGGPVLTANPEPFADFFDVILLGDGENLLPNLIERYKQVRNASKETQLKALAQVPGIYVPSLYEVEYETQDGEIKSIKPICPEIPSVVQKQTYRGNTLSTSTVVTEKAAWENIYMVEVVRSCPEMCRFCLASYLTLPFRTASLEGSLIPAMEKGLAVTNRLGLLGASVTQHPEFEALLNYISQPKYDHVRLSIASVRTNTVTVQLAETLAKRDTRSLTIAVESGSEKLRQIINKKLHNDEIIQAAVNAKAGGLKSLKFYGMVGIPGEETADLQQTVAMMQSIKKAAPGLRLTFGCSTFVPKAHTPFQWFGVNPHSEKRLQMLQKQLKPQGIEFRPESYNWSIIQALLSRGDRRLSQLLELTRGFGDSLGSYKRAFKQLKGQIPDLEFYVHSNWSTQQILPWNHLQGPLPRSTLLKHLADSFPGVALATTDVNSSPKKLQPSNS
ncbi:B12-binding domain-containing radical SAM protein [Umezakia ovalisporum]|uniref:B12-binding domain-containing radical SAM protein n=1 Tax=Umezakia ovalisporum FSS-43 TaxID=2740520 RepID=A0ABT6K0L0_9CYAN|nr:radical SAM protein [Umezakia ovalisporum]MDH6055863.1 B12-binding domain-containing radical SAM protein [Umezakia ovalisporum FSS-43]MDH6068143.1 B12-binding domain-containing radical SAM protein [Umezakia ovalisporum APH033B]MDH6069348.1 B12-binding domain-containing radical SAM protein [Umezakia ovalisporum CobakiLakeA]MDH6076011.1 B12-binding domain-containing radical SAM protein [Umezakia ovalisporum CS-1034]MDH6078111.1 B12-binding domain-containing radical SAM protein [Umezakia ovali